MSATNAAPAPARERVRYKHISKRFGADDKIVDAVRDVSLSIASGEIVALIGPSGCGKSTLLNMGAGLYPPTSGEVAVDGEPVVGPNEHVAFMLQKDLLLPWRTIRENVEFGLEIKRVDAGTRREAALSLLKRFHLDGFENHYPHQLSGGMRQRAAIARTLAVNPAVLLMDEPFSALDAQTKMVLQQDLAEMLVRDARTALFITHDLVEAIILSDRVAVMSARPGHIIEEIVVDLPNRGDPFARRRSPSLTQYVDRLMELLQIGRSVPV